MAALKDGLKYKLLPADEFTHDPGEAENYNESMYFNAFDAGQKLGAWFRLGNRPNQNYAEMSVCIYLPNGKVGFIFARPEITDNSAMRAGGMEIEIVKPLQTLKLKFDGKVLLMDDPLQMADPKLAFSSNSKVPCSFELTYEGVSPMYGGEVVREDGSSLEIDPEKSFAKAHYEQHCAITGQIKIGDQSFDMDGLGLRDKSWGPRHWQAIEWYRWCPMNFGPDFGIMFNVMSNGKGGVAPSGMVLRDGKYDHITACELESDWDQNDYQTALRARIETESGATYDIEGKVLSLIPLRNRRTTPDGETLQTRLTEGMTEYRCGDRIGYGMSEYLDQIVDEKPIGRAAGY